MKRLASDGLRTCRRCAAKQTNARSQSASKAGKVGGRVTTDNGKLQAIAGKLANSPEAHKKRFETLKRTGQLFTSRPEQELLKLLQEKFGIDDVEHHVYVDGYRIDFYVKSVETYVQLDGVYWHGLNVPYDELRGTPKEKFDRDRRCDLHFSQVGKKLVRITDIDVKEGCALVKFENSLVASATRRLDLRSTGD